jgi:hypothetical protein
MPAAGSGCSQDDRQGVRRGAPKAAMRSFGPFVKGPRGSGRRAASVLLYRLSGMAFAEQARALQDIWNRHGVAGTSASVPDWITRSDKGRKDREVLSRLRGRLGSQSQP